MDILLSKFVTGLKRQKNIDIIEDIYPKPKHKQIKRKGDIAVIWGGFNLERIKRLYPRFIVVERAYVGNRFEWTSAGYDGLNGRADFCIDDQMPSDRWERHHQDCMQEWDTSGNYILLVGQKQNDIAVRHIKFSRWIEKTRSFLDHYNIPTIYRPHPGLRKSEDFDKYMEVCGDGLNSDLYQVLKQAKYVITFNSNTGVLAVLAGTPTIAIDEGSMVYGLVQNDIESVIGPPHTPDRTQWAHNIAYCQWSPEELENGDFWELLKRGATECN